MPTSAVGVDEEHTVSAASPGSGPSTHASPPAVSPAVGDPRSTAQILGDVVGEVQTLVRKEIELAKQEMAAAAAARAQGIALFVVAGLFGLYALGWLGVTIGAALRTVMAAWIAWAIVFALYLLVAIAAVLIGRSRMTSTPMAPEQTKRSIEETKQWATQQLRR